MASCEPFPPTAPFPNSDAPGEPAVDAAWLRVQVLLDQLGLAQAQLSSLTGAIVGREQDPSAWRRAHATKSGVWTFGAGDYEFGSRTAVLPPKQLLLLERLVTCHRYAVSYEGLCDAVWPEEPRDKNNLKDLVCKLRKHLLEIWHLGSNPIVNRGRSGYYFDHGAFTFYREFTDALPADGLIR